MKLKKPLMQSPYGHDDITEKLLTYQKVQYFSGIRGDGNANLYKHYKDFSDDEDEEDSMFGSFNPNLRTKEATMQHSVNRRDSTSL